MQLNEKIPEYDAFKKCYYKHNERLWAEYRHGRIVKDHLRIKRFELAFKEFKIKDVPLINEFAKSYLALCSDLPIVIPHSHEMLETLSKKYRLHILSNGFSTAQDRKLAAGNLRKYFDLLIYSEVINKHKPHAEIFNYALKLANCPANKAIMVGDDYEVDILGAYNVGIDQIYYAPEGANENQTSTFIISDLIDITQFL